MQGDGRGSFDLLTDALQALAHLDTRASRLDAASALADEALRWAIRAGDDWDIARAHWEMALAAPTIADVRQLTELAATQRQQVGNVARLTSLLSSAAYAALCESSDDDAKAFLKRAELDRACAGGSLRADADPRQRRARLIVQR